MGQNGKEKYFDFDAAMEERSGKPVIVKAFGEEYKLPGQLPFDIVLKISRKYKEGQDEMDESDIIEMAHTLFGAEVFEAWLAKGISIDGVGVMVEGVMKMYMQQASSTAGRMADAKNNSNP